MPLDICCLFPGNPADTEARATASDQDGDIKRVSTKDWARSTGYDAVKLFNKVGFSVNKHLLKDCLSESVPLSCQQAY